MHEQSNITNHDQSLHSALQALPDFLIKKIERLAQQLTIDPGELLLWLGKYASLETSTLISLVHLAITYQLDPLMGEVVLWSDVQKQAHPSITIDGWMKIINDHPAFAGIEFEDGPALDNGGVSPMPQFMQCTIYRTDRQLPIRVKEYFEEVKSDSPLWKSMPRRMLRHRVLQQCARLAFGISTPEFAFREFAPSTQAPSRSPEKEWLGSSTVDHALKPEGLMDAKNPKRLTRTEQLKARLTKNALAPTS